jgi:hypothetical protein
MEDGVNTHSHIDLKVYSRSRKAEEKKHLPMDITKMEENSCSKQVFYWYLRKRGLHDPKVCLLKRRKPRAFTNLVERNNMSKILEKNFKEREARELMLKEKFPLEYKSLVSRHQPGGNDNQESIFERLFALSKSVVKHPSNNHEIRESNIKPLKNAPKRKKATIKFDSYCAREQHKIQANFLQHISWEIINKMNSRDLAAQINGRIMAEKVKIKGLTNSKENPGSSDVLAYDTHNQDKNTKLKIKRILNYGKLPKQDF